MTGFASGTLRCGRVFKVPVKVHWTLFIAAPVWFLLFMREWRHLTVDEYMWGISLVLCLIMSLFIHELGHLCAMKLGGMRVTSIVLHGFGGATVPASPVLHMEEFSRRKCLALGNFAAGPAANVALAAAFFTLRAVVQMSGVEEGPILDFWHGDDASLWFMYAAFMNLALAIYNLLPIYPLDGGHIFYYLFCFCLPERWARYATTGVTFVMGAAVVCVEAIAFTAGKGSLISLGLVATICLFAVLMSCATSYDSYARHKRLFANGNVGVGVPRDNTAHVAPVRLREVELADLPV